MRVQAIIVAATLLTVTTGAAVAQTNPAGPVANGDFESFAVPDEVKEPLQGTPADQCVGIGHQVNWGSDSPQQALAGADPAEVASDPENADPSPTNLADRYSEDPDGQAQSDAEEQSGVGHCEFSDEKGHDAYWLNPTQAGGTTEDDAALWSEGDHTTVGFNLDADPFDKEIQISGDDDGGDHNLWQNMFHPGREYAFTANFDALEFDVEDGSIAEDAYVQVSLGAEPGNVQEPFAVVYIDCAITFPGSYLQASLDDGRVSASPVEDGAQYSGDLDCPQESVWESSSPEDRREMLGRLSIVQVSFWNFNDGDEPIVIDDIALPGATTHAEEAANGNVRLCPDFVDQTADPEKTVCEDDTVGQSRS